MAAIVIVSAVVSVVPVATSGTWTGYATLPTTCVLAPGQISCPVTEKFAATKTATWTSTSTIQAVTNTLETFTESTKLSSTTPSPSQETTSGTAAAAGASAPESNQVGIALGVAFALLILSALGWLLFAWRTKKGPFRKKVPESEEDGVPMAEIGMGADNEARNYIGPMPKESPSRPVSAAPLTRPPSSRYSQDVDSNKTLAGPTSAWSDTASSISRHTATVAKDFIGASSEQIVSPYDLPPVRSYSENGFRSVFGSVPSTPPPTAPLPALPFDAVLKQQTGDRRSNVYRHNFPGNPVIAQERGLSAGTETRNWFGGGNNGSNWSLQRQLGSQSSRASLKRQPSDDSDVTRSEYNKMTGFEYLMQTGNGGEAKKD
ncbi:hypothetical protein Slin15195_G055820 [Septoria linicola]|uniref:Uncharacterized protein n=1 Tax=Septoria linicola TaxID=215465 RepID=A0A9Q9EKC8_9PEZI|nr:hypothetical protein Slin14017_G071690 [Septoria linicola]USW52263.1 hypothetical protein Slin15195_G055820 [Septoria linicola]